MDPGKGAIGQAAQFVCFAPDSPAEHNGCAFWTSLLSGLLFHRQRRDCVANGGEKDVEIHKNLVVIAERIWYSGFCLILDEMAGKITSLSRGCAAPAGVACPIWNALLVPQEALLSEQSAGEWLCGKPLRHCGTAWHGSCGCPIGAVDLWVLAELPGIDKE